MNSFFTSGRRKGISSRELSVPERTFQFLFMILFTQRNAGLNLIKKITALVRRSAMQSKALPVHILPCPVQGQYSPAQGYNSPASQQYSPTQGQYFPASGKHSPAQGYNSPASEQYSPTQGQCFPAQGKHSPASGHAAAKQVYKKSREIFY
jgi:hypothetical protein